MISTGTKRDQVMLMSDVFLLSFVQWFVVHDVILYTAVLLIRRTIDGHQMLRGLENGGLGPRSEHVSVFALRLSLTVRVESTLDLFQQSLSWHKLVSAKSPSVACRNIVSIVLVQPFLQNTQDVLFLKKEAALQVAKATIYGE